MNRFRRRSAHLALLQSEARATDPRRDARPWVGRRGRGPFASAWLFWWVPRNADAAGSLDALAGVPHPEAAVRPAYLTGILAHAHAAAERIRSRGARREARLQAKRETAGHRRARALERHERAGARASREAARLERLSATRVGRGMSPVWYLLVVAGSLLIDFPLNRIAFSRLAVNDQWIALLAAGVCLLLVVFAHLLGGRLAHLVTSVEDAENPGVPSRWATWISSAFWVVSGIVVLAFVLVTLNHLRITAEQFDIRITDPRLVPRLAQELEVQLIEGHNGAFLALQGLVVLIMAWLRFESALGEERRAVRRARRRAAFVAWAAGAGAARQRRRETRLARRIEATMTATERAVRRSNARHRARAARYMGHVARAYPEQGHDAERWTDGQWPKHEAIVDLSGRLRMPVMHAEQPSARALVNGNGNGTAAAAADTTEA